MRSIPTAHPPRGAARRRLALPALLLTAALAALAAGCSGGSGGSATEGDSVDFSALREDAEEARAAAKEANADEVAAELFAKAEEYLAKAIDLESDPEATSKTRAQYQRARDKFRESIDATKQLSGKLDEISGDLAALEKLRDEVKASGADQQFPDPFEKAQKNIDDAKAAATKGDIPLAKREIRYAQDDLKTVQQLAAQRAQYKGQADEEKALLATAKAEAEAAKAQELAASDWQWASDMERDGNVAYDSSDFQKAIGLFRQAKSGFTSAKSFAQTQAAADTAQSSGREEDGLAHRPRGADDIPDVGEIDVPDISGDEIDLFDVPSLFAGSAKLEAGNKLTLDWESGVEFQKDDTILQGTDKFIVYEGWESAGIGETFYVFTGNTEGYLLVEAGFENGATVKAHVNFQLVLSKAVFEIVVMAQDDPKNFYAVDFGSAIKLYDDANGYVKARSPDPLHAKQPKDWVKKGQPYDIEVKYYKGEGQEGEIRAYIDGVETCRWTNDKYTKGKVGFRWSNTKFVVRELEVIGLVDEAWALEALKAKREREAKKPEKEEFGF